MSRAISRFAAGLTVVFALAGAGLGFVGVQSVGATTPIVVNSTLDQAASSPGSTTCNSTGDLCTLRAAIDAANSGGGGGVIDVPNGHYTLTILPVSPDDDATGDLNITGNVTIVGNVANPGAVVIDGDGTSGGGGSRVLDIDSGGAATISGVTITNGNPHNDGPFSLFSGGGILADGPLTLSNSVVTANEIPTVDGGDGAGIDVIAGALTLDAVTVSTNGNTGTPNDGGAIELNTGTKLTDTIENSTISDNKAVSDGGGIHQSDTSTIAVTKTTITGNTTGARGGGFYDNNNTNANPSGTVTFTDSTISNNDASTGGGFYNDHGSNITFADSTISGNVASDGGGGGFELVANPSIVHITGSTISGNSTTTTGGGIDNSECDTLNLTNDTVAANTAISGGGGFYGASNGGEGGACAAGQGVNFLYDTAAGNTAGTGGGDVNLGAGAALNLTNSIVAGGNPTCAVGASASLASGGYNLLGDSSCGTPAGTDLVGQNPQLGSLANNGGPTLTELPGSASPAISAIPAAVCTAAGVSTDQRGVARGGGNCTIGAVEVALANNGYRMGADEGGVFDFGLNFNGSLANNHLNAPIVGIANSPGVNGYLLVGGDGGVFALGGASFFGSLGGQAIAAPITAIASTPAGDGYWLASWTGTIYHFGNTPSLPAVQVPSGAHIVGMASSNDGKGAWLTDNFGDVYAEGDAQYIGGLGGVHINAPIVGIAAAATGQGYILAAADGGAFNYGMGFYGSVPGSLAAGQHLVAPVVGIAVTHSGKGYWMVGADGGLFDYGDAPFLGSIYTAIPGKMLNGPIIGIQHLGAAPVA